eukprot:352970-Chlamydomonas_euryale.AAC.2
MSLNLLDSTPPPGMTVGTYYVISMTSCLPCFGMLPSLTATQLQSCRYLPWALPPAFGVSASSAATMPRYSTGSCSADKTTDFAPIRLRRLSSSSCLHHLAV